MMLLWAALLSLPMAALVGTATAFFLMALDWATQSRYQNPWLLFLLPLAGAVMVSIYHHYGRKSDEGNNLIIDEIHQPGGGVPFRMTPLVLFSTVATHLFGGSAGREGTAVQMGGSLAAEFSRRFRLNPLLSRHLLMAGIAAGFGAVFGTPLAGAIFAMEVLTAGSLEYGSALPCLAAAFCGDISCRAWGVQHSNYHLGIFSPAAADMSAWNWSLGLKVTLAAALFGLCGRFFAELSHRLSAALKKIFPIYWLRPVAGGLAVVGLCYVIGSTDYLGLGVTSPGGEVSILSSFQAGGATLWSWLWKTIFTALTLSSGFKGGEVTPLFFIGASLGNCLAVLMSAPVDLFAGLGFVAVFSGATNTPFACTFMAAELFGPRYIVYFLIACFLAWKFSGKISIYKSQR
jgi:H+/Cl- antiporter ClcA